MTQKIALITGITGQDGTYLAHFLLEKGYSVHGLYRRASLPNTQRLELHLGPDAAVSGAITLHEGDLTDTGNISALIAKLRPDEIYNLGAQSHVATSFSAPEYTANVDAIGTLRILEAIRTHGLVEKTKLYQASTSELFGLVQETPQRETTPFYPRSPYAVAKMYAYWICVNYREAYGIFACNGILFNHESPLRGEDFVTRKITRGLARVHQGTQPFISLGNLDALRDWGHARDYVEMQWLMLQRNQPRDYVIATGEQHSVRSFVDRTASAIGLDLQWSGTGIDEHATVSRAPSDSFVREGQVVVKVDPRYFRPAEVQTLLGDSSRARTELQWQPQVSFDSLVEEMATNDLLKAKFERLASASRKGSAV